VIAIRLKSLTNHNCTKAKNLNRHRCQVWKISRQSEIHDVTDTCVSKSITPQRLLERLRLPRSVFIVDC